MVKDFAIAGIIFWTVIACIAVLVVAFDVMQDTAGPVTPADSLPAEVVVDTVVLKETIHVGVTEEEVHDLIHRHQPDVFECQDFVIIGGANGQGASWRCR